MRTTREAILTLSLSKRFNPTSRLHWRSSRISPERQTLKMRVTRFWEEATDAMKWDSKRHRWNILYTLAKKGQEHEPTKTVGHQTSVHYWHWHNNKQRFLPSNHEISSSQFNKLTELTISGLIPLSSKTAATWKCLCIQAKWSAVFPF